MILTAIVAAAAEQGVGGLSSGAAALLGALIGGVTGAGGQYLTERVRQKGELRHQNRLLLQQTYVDALAVASELNREVVVLQGDLTTERLDESSKLTGEERRAAAVKKVGYRLQPLMARILDLNAAVEAVGSFRVSSGLTQLMYWTIALSSTQHVEADRRWSVATQTATSAIGEWNSWLAREIRSELRVKSDKKHDRLRGDHPPFAPGPHGSHHRSSRARGGGGPREGVGG